MEKKMLAKTTHRVSTGLADFPPRRASTCTSRGQPYPCSRRQRGGAACLPSACDSPSFRVVLFAKVLLTSRTQQSGLELPLLLSSPVCAVWTPSAGAGEAEARVDVKALSSASHGRLTPRRSPEQRTRRHTPAPCSDSS